MKKFKYTFYFFLICLVISFLLNSRCIFYGEDTDPLKGGGDNMCLGDISIVKIIINAFGLFIFGYVSKSILEEFKKDDEKKRDEEKMKKVKDKIFEEDK